MKHWNRFLHLIGWCNGDMIICQVVSNKGTTTVFLECMKCFYRSSGVTWNIK